MSTSRQELVMRVHLVSRLVSLALVLTSAVVGCGDDAASSGASSGGGSAEGGGGADASTTVGQGGASSTTSSSSAGGEGGAGQGGGDGGAGGAALECDPGYTGPDCTDCADGYQDADADGVCALGCAATGADALDCGANGVCEDSAVDGQRACVCDEGYEGDLCDGCASGYVMSGGECVFDLPATNGLTLWLDAGENTLSVIATGKLSSWGDRRGSQVASLTPPTVAAQPTRVGNGLGGRPVIRFDGDDVLEVSGLPTFQGANYAIIAVVKPTSQSGNVILRSHSELNVSARVARTATGYTLFHQPFNQPQVSTAITGLGTEARVWTATRFTSPVLKFHRMLARDAGDDLAFDQVTNTTSPDLGSFTGSLRIGGGGFAGDVAELLVYDRQVALDEIEDVQAYLAAKYQLD
jgi:hypothetical protein